MTARILPGSVDADRFGDVPFILPDVPLPVAPRALHHPEHSLLAAILGAAIDDAVSDDPVRIAAAQHWFDTDPDAGRPFSFLWLCEHLGLDPAAVRDAVLRRQLLLPPRLREQAATVVDIEDRGHWGTRAQRNRCSRCRQLHICRYVRRMEFRGGRPSMICRDCWPKLPGKQARKRSHRADTVRRVDAAISALSARGGRGDIGEMTETTGTPYEDLRLGLNAAIRRGLVVRLRPGLYALTAAEVAS